LGEAETPKIYSDHTMTGKQLPRLGIAGDRRIAHVHHQQLPLSSRRNWLPVKCIYWSLLMPHEHSARALVELRQIGQAPSGADPVLHHAPEAFNGIEVVAATSWQAMQPTLLVPVCQRRRELVRPVDATAVDHHDDLFPGVAQEGHHLMDILAQPLRIKMGDDLRENLRGAILDRANDTEQDPAGHAAPTPVVHPRLAFAGLVAFDLAVAQGPCGQTSALRFAPPAHPGQGKTPDDGFIFIEQDDLTPTGLGLQGGKCESTPRQLSGGRSEPPRGTAGADVFFFHTSRTLSRLSWTPVWRASTVASA